MKPESFSTGAMLAESFELGVRFRQNSYERRAARPSGWKPGDLILNKYMPNATSKEREEARDNLKAYVAAVMQIQKRIAREEAEKKDAIDPRADSDSRR